MRWRLLCGDLTRSGDRALAPLRTKIGKQLTSVWHELSELRGQVFAKIYDDFWNGIEPDWAYLEQIVLIDPKAWEAGPEAVAEALAEIEEARRAKAEATSAEYMRAALGDFRFDQASELLHIIPFEEDTQHLSGDALARFLDDAVTARQNLEALSQRCRKSNATQLQGQVAATIDVLLDALSQARQLNTLNARIVITFCADLQDFTADSYTMDNLGHTGRALDRRITELNALIWKAFRAELDTLGNLWKVLCCSPTRMLPRSSSVSGGC